MRTNSIISDPTPYTISERKPQVKQEPTDWEKLANGSKYSAVRNYLNDRITYYQRFTPSGQAIEGLTIEQRVENWNIAVTIINEFEGLLKTLEAHKHNG